MAEEKFTLTLPTQKEIKAEIEEKVQVTDENKEVIQEVANSKVQEIMGVDLADLSQRTAIVKSIEDFGADSMIASERKNDFLSKRIGSFQNNSNETSEVATNLTALSVRMKELDPSGINFSKEVKNRLVNPIRKYFAKYEKADASIKGIIEVLDRGKRQLENDNKTLLIEVVALENETKKLNEYVQMGSDLDASIQTAIDQARSQGEDEKKINFVETEVLFPLRQRIEDMLTIVAVNIQGIGALELIRRNNAELIHGVERSKAVSIRALRTAVIAAQALSDQKIVINAINAVNEATETMITATARMLGQQSGEIQEMMSNPMIAVDKLKEAYTLTYDAFDTFDNYKRNALPQMAKDIETFRELANDGAERIKRIQEAREYRGETTE